MTGRYLLDTNIIIALFANEESVRSQFAQAEVFLSSIAVGELYYGARKSARTTANLERINELVTESTVLHCDVETAQHYGGIKAKLRIKGRPLPENDIWIAAIALQHKLILVTRDAHFQEVENLQRVAW